MIVTILEGEENKSGKLLSQADLGLLKTDMKTVGGQRLYEVVKNRYGPNGRYIGENNIRDYVQDYERKEQERKSPEGARRSQSRPPSEDFDEMFQQ